MNDRPNSNPEEIEQNNPETFNQTERLQTEHNDPSIPYQSFSKQEFDRWLKIALIYLLTFSLLLIWQNLLFPLYFCFLPSIFYELLSLLNQFIRLRLRTENYEKTLIIKEIIENTGSLTTKLLILLYLIKPDFKICLTVIPITITTSINFVIKSISLNKCQIFSEIMLVLTRVIRVLTAFSLFLKIDGFYSYDWPLIFWPIWTYITLISLVFLFFLFLTVNLIKTRQLTVSQIIGSLYLLASLLLSLLSFTIFFISLSRLSPNFYPPLAFLLLFTTITFAYKEKLQISISKFLNHELETNTSRASLPESRPKFAAPFISALNKPKMFLVKISDFYFTASDKLRPAKKRTSSVNLNPAQFLFHKRSLTSEQSSRRVKLEEGQALGIDAEKCLMCFEKFANAVVMNCGHGGLCFECGFKLDVDGRSCHICRGKIESIVRVLQHPGGVHEVITECDS